MVEKIEKHKVSPWIHFAAGGFGGTVGAVITCPLEVVKTRLQSSLYGHDGHRTVYAMLRDIYRNEGVSGLWRGLGPNLVGVVPARAIYFSTYASTKHYMVARGMGVSADGKETPLIHLISAITAGVATSTTTNPIWLIKTRMQLQNSSLPLSNSASVTTSSSNSRSGSSSKATVYRKSTSAGFSSSAALKSMTTTEIPIYKNSFDCLVKVIRQEGVLSLFRGLSASYLGILEGTMQWIAYEQIKKVSSSSSSNLNGINGGNNGKFSIRDTFVAAGAAKFIAAITTYPHEVLRTRLRQATVTTELVNGHLVSVGRPKYSGIVDVCKTVFRQEGIMAFYGGLSAHLLRTVPNAAIMFLCYEGAVFFFD